MDFVLNFVDTKAELMQREHSRFWEKRLAPLRSRGYTGMQKYKDRSIYLLPRGIATGRKENNFQFKSGFIQKFSPEDQSGDHISLNAYHYTSPEAFLSIIQNHSIRFTDIRYMNDRAEGIYFVKLLLDFVEKNRGNYPHFEEVINQLLKGNDLEKIRTLATTEIQYEEIPRLPYHPNRVFVFCTCTEVDSLNMWNYYTNTGVYQGYNIGFRLFDLLRSFDTPSSKVLDPILVHYGKVLYEEKKQFEEITRLAEEIEIKASKSPNALKREQIHLRMYIDSKGAFFKHPKFKSEQEFRIIVEMPEAKIPRQKDDPKKYVGVHNQELWEGFCTKHGLIVPFLNVSFSKEAIQRITIAPMVEYEIAKKSIRELLECQRIKNVQIYKSTIPIRF